MSQEDNLTPTRIAIFRQISDLLKAAKSLEEARKKYRELVTSLVLGESE